MIPAYGRPYIPFLDLAVDVSVRCCKVCEIVVLDDIIGHVSYS
jgi:hypothetical protein